MKESPIHVSQSGFFTGVAAIMANVIEQVLHPFEVVKLRFQSHDGQEKRNLVPKYKSIAQALMEIGKTEGMRGLYRGVVLSAMSSNAAKFIFFGLFGMEKQRYENKFGKKSQMAIVFASLEASIIATVLTSPLWVIKTRLILNTKTETTGFQNMLTSIKEVYTHHGPYGFFRGLQLSLALSTYGIIQMTLYENFKLLANYDATSPTSVPAMCGIASKCITSLLLYPINVIRTRIQQNQFIESPDMKYKGIFDCAAKIRQLEGYRGFYKGFIPSTIRAVPSNAIFFFFFEYFKKIFYKWGYLENP